ncbi:MAG: peptidyl-prolyl cis-trans isomerase [Candidatus Omnitrophota bacterium]
MLKSIFLESLNKLNFNRNKLSSNNNYNSLCRIPFSLRLKCFFGAIFMILSLFYSGPAVCANDGIVAIVNNEVITQKDLDDFINFMRIQLSSRLSVDEVEQRINQMLPDLINRLIEDRLILQEAHKQGIIVDQNRIKARIEQIKEKYPSESHFNDELVSQGLSLSEIAAKIQEQFLMFKIINAQIRSKIQVKPQEVTDYYYDHPKSFVRPEERKVRLLTIKDASLTQELKELIPQLRSNLMPAEDKKPSDAQNDLDAIAEAYSLEITDFGWVTKKQLKDDISDMVFALEAGKISAPFYTDNKDYIFEVSEVKLSYDAPLDEVQEEISEFLFEEKMQEASVKWLQGLRSEAYIEIKG